MRTNSMICSRSLCRVATSLVAILSALMGNSAHRFVQADDSKSPGLLTAARQLTFEGRRAGEGYYRKDGLAMVFQSEREAENPFFQIYTMDLETGDVVRVSPGHGKTTCAWFHPDGRRILFASTHDDPDAREEQKAELKLRADGKERRYSWDYDEYFDLYYFDRESKKYTNLTKTRGYNAEGSVSNDGKWIAFASNRRAYDGSMTSLEKDRFENDPSIMMDLYVMQSDGGNVRQITDVLGYDGGPFFSPESNRICFRRFSVDGATAEIMTIGLDGSDVKQLTRMEALSWAPYYHPSGEYLIYATNVHGFANFELYMVDVEGKHSPVRVTEADGFDGLPVFSPDGKQLTWTSNRTSTKKSQLFVGKWDHQLARKKLGLGDREAVNTTSAEEAAAADATQTNAAITSADIMRHVDYLCRAELGGRATGTPGEKLATAYVAAYFDHLGLQPAGDNGSYFQSFSFTAGISLGSDAKLKWGDRTYQVNQDWRPVAFSGTGPVKPAPLVFAGYGIVAPPREGEELGYDSYVHLPVKDKWVVVLRFLPDDLTAEKRQRLSRYAGLRYKAMVARDKGARGLIVVSGPHAQVKNEVIPLRFEGSAGGSSLPVISVSNAVAQTWFKTADKDLGKLQKELDSGNPVMGFDVGEIELSAQIDLNQERRIGRNVLARLPADKKSAGPFVIVGAHVDHLGRGQGGSSLAKDDEKGSLHFGADDNASGVAALLEMAQFLSSQKRSGKLTLKKDLVFAAWSGEELGLLGSSHFAEKLQAAGNEKNPKAHPVGLNAQIAACLNLDMVGRLREKLVLQGVGSSPIWLKEIERRNAPVGLALAIQNDGYIPTDGSVFYQRGVPMLSAFTGAHSEYHTPRDLPDTINYDGAAKIAKLMALIARGLTVSEDAPKFVAAGSAPMGSRGGGLRAYLGTIPDYASEGIKGVQLSGVGKNGPAAKAGVKGGDIIVELAGKKIENIYDYTYALEAVKIGKPVKMVVLRKTQRVTLQVVPESRQ